MLGHRFEQFLVGLVVVSVCVSMLQHALPHLVPAIVVLGAVILIGRLVFFHTRKW